MADQKDDPEKKLKPPKKAFKEGDLPDTKEGWIEYVNSVHEAGLGERRKFEFSWITNYSYFLGLQNIAFNPRSGLLEVAQDDRPPLTVNRIAPFVEFRHAKLTKQRPQARVIPNTEDLEDRRAAKYSDDLITHLWRKIGFEDEFDLMTMQMLICGVSFIKTVWNPLTGDIIKNLKYSKDKELFLDDEGKLEHEEIFMGEVSSRHFSPFSIIPANFYITNVKDQPYMLERNHMSVSEIEQMYPHLRGKVKLQDKFDQKTPYERLIERMTNSYFQNAGATAKDDRDSINSEVLVKTLMVKPNAQYKKGVIVVVIGDKELGMIDQFPNDYGENIYPQVRFVEHEDGFKFFPPATIERLIPIQRAYNQLRQQKAKSAALMANPKWIVAKGSQLQEDALNNEEGEIIETNPSVFEPHQAQIAPLPNYVQAFEETLIRDFRDCAGQRETSSNPQSNLTAGVALQVANDIGDEALIPLLRRQARSLAAVGNIQLELVNQEYDEPRRIKIIGDGGKTGVQWMSRLDLRNQTDVHIEVESMIPDSRTIKRQVLMDWWDRRIIDDPVKFMRAFRYGSFDVLLEEEEKKEDTVTIDIQRMKRGKEAPIHPFQDHMLYIKMLSKFIDSPEFLRLIPERKQQFFAALQQHIQMLQGQMPNQGEPMAQTNQAAVGTPFGPQKTVGLR